MSDPPPVLTSEGEDALTPWSELFGVFYEPGPDEGIMAPGRQVTFEGTLAERADGQSYKHICLEVDDIEATVSTLRSRGVEVSPIKLGKDNSYQAWITDPDGNRMELHGYTAESWQAPSLS